MQSKLPLNKQRVLRWLWFGVGLFYVAVALVYVFVVPQLDISWDGRDVLGFRADEGASVADVVAANRELLAVSDVLPAPLLPDLVAHTPSGLDLIGSRDDDSLQLRFTTRFSNQDDGPLEVRPDANDVTGQQLMQVVYSNDPDAELITHTDAGSYVFEQAHGHLHLATFARYELWSVSEVGQPLVALVSNPKVGFCLIDAEALPGTVVESRVYWGCRSEVQGLSPGWSDVYVAQLAMQSLNISALPDGRYALVNIINYAGTLVESNLSNNDAWTYFVLEQGRLSLN
ncbi:MAG: lysyl oxidase family protein [Deinococcota bacterium]